TQVVQLCTANVATADHLDLVDGRRVHRKLTLDADLEADLANSEGFANALAVAGKNDTLKHLHTRTVALDDVHVHLHRVTGTKIRNVGFQRCGIDRVELLHDCLSLRPPQVGTHTSMYSSVWCLR